MTRLMFAVAAGMILAITALTGSACAADAILIEFSSPHCAPCKAMQGTLEELQRSGVPIRRVDVVAERQMAVRYGIRKTPTFVVVSGGKEVTRLVGMKTVAELRAALSIDPSGPLIPTGSKSASLDDIPAPQTRLAPIHDSSQTLASVPAIPHTATAPRSEAMPSVAIADAVQRARAATVRLRVHDGHGYGAGTGTIIDTHGEEALVLTCGHLFRETKGKGKIEVDLFLGGQTRTVLGQVIDYDADSRDIALVAIRPGFPVQPVSVVGSDSHVRNGQTAFSFGCDRGDDPSRRDTRITGINKYNQHLGVSNLEISGAPIDGRSGGGLFDAKGDLIGVCNAADYKGDVGIYAGPGSIRWQLDRVNLAHLFDRASTSNLADSSAPSSSVSPQPSAATAPPERLASAGGSDGIFPASALQPSVMAPEQGTSGREVIVIVRDPHHPSASSRVMTLANPTAGLMQMIESQAK